MRITIHQPQYLPWLGYLDKIDRADYFVVLDTVQFKKNEWQNRNRIRTAQGWQWLTVPVRHHFGQRINEVHIDESRDWRERHLRAIAMHYNRAPFTRHYLEEIRSLLDRKIHQLAPLNIDTIRWLMSRFGMSTPLLLASQIPARDEPTERLIDICKELGATRYLAGPGAGGYMDIGKFQDAGINVEIQDFHHPRYRQCYEPFEPYLSALDLLLNHGNQALDCLRSLRGESETKRPTGSFQEAVPQARFQT